MKKYCKDEVYQAFFNGINEKNGYGNYIGAIRKNGHTYKMDRCKSEEDFYKGLQKILSTIVPDQEDEELLEKLKAEVENQTLLPLARSRKMEQFRIRFIFRN